MDEVLQLGITGMGALLDRREISSVELTRMVLDRIGRRADLDAFVAVTPDRALAEAAEADRELAAGRRRGALHGIPYAVKDLLDVDGEVTAAGSRLLADNVADRDATVVARLAAAGAVLVGKTQTVQFAYGGAGVNHDTGSPRNPWRTDEHYVAGGSSSGSGVAVAAGIVPFAIGTDTSGSVRIPASLCGITGLKTTVGRVSRAGAYPLSPTLDSVGPLARSVADCAAVYDVIHGPDAADPTTIAVPPDPVGPALGTGVAGMRLAFLDNYFFDGADPEVAAAVRATGDVFAGLGAEVIGIEAPEVDEVMAGSRAWTVAAEACLVNRRFLTESFDEMDPVVAHRMRRGFEVTAVEYLEAFEAWARLRQSFARRTEGIDAFLIPATMYAALPLAEVDADYAVLNAAYLRNTSIGNRFHWCGYSVPCGFTTDGLPIGLSIQVPANQEGVATSVAHAYQTATDWAGVPEGES